MYIGCDNNPLSFQDMMDATFACGKFAGSCEFTGEGGDPGKKVNNSKTRAAVKWEPKYGSFVAFMKGGADDFYATSGLF